MISPTRAVVTGAGGGLGRAFCLELAARGARVLASDIDEASARATAEQCRGEAIGCDVSRLADVEALAAAADERIGGCDLLVNNAGVAVTGRVGEIAPEDWRWQIDVNLWGVIHGCHVFVPRFRAARAGHILNVASLAGLVYLPLFAPYNATKAAVVALSETLSTELSADGVGVTVLCPSFFQTRIIADARAAEAIRRIADEMMKAERRTAADVARYALDAVARNELHALPMPQGRWLWRIKRLFPRRHLGLLRGMVARESRKYGVDLGI
jgi:NAD(P)-dependent dehydrogenase (short-subunit alcohol dehydrogenase family)